LLSPVSLCALCGEDFDLLPAHRVQTTPIEFQQMGRVILGLGGRASALEADSGPDGLAVAGCHSDEFHEVERDIFITAGAEGKSGYFHDKNSW
jgi:hypothetical protein